MNEARPDMKHPVHCAESLLTGVIFSHVAVGKLRKRWVNETLSPTGVELLKAIKEKIDPSNIFGCGNLIP